MASPAARPIHYTEGFSNGLSGENGMKLLLKALLSYSGAVIAGIQLGLVIYNVGKAVKKRGSLEMSEAEQNAIEKRTWALYEQTVAGKKGQDAR